MIPMQPIYKDKHGTPRFKENKIVSFLLDFANGHGTSLNELSRMDFSKEDWTQLAQLMGYSVRGFGELSYVSDADYLVAEQSAENPEANEKDVRIAVLEKQLKDLKDGIREPIAALFGRHPDDLN